MSLGLNYKILLQRGWYYNADIGNCAEILDFFLTATFLQKTGFFPTGTNEESARTQAHAFLSKIHTKQNDQGFQGRTNFPKNCI